MQTLTIGTVVTIDSRKRRFMVTYVGQMADGDPDVNLRALSGSDAGSGPSGIRGSRLTVDPNQRIDFSGAMADKLRRDAVRALIGVGRMSARKVGEEEVKRVMDLAVKIGAEGGIKIVAI